jgi:hypothetical protein
MDTPSSPSSRSQDSVRAGLLSIPPVRAERKFDFFQKKELPSNLFIPTLGLEEEHDRESPSKTTSPILRPRSSSVFRMDVDGFINSPFMFADPDICPSPAFLEEDSFSLSDDSVEDALVDHFTTSNMGDEICADLNISTGGKWTWPLPSWQQQPRVTLKPRPMPNNVEEHQHLFLPLRF